MLTAARTWLAQDPDPATRAELEQLITDTDAGDAAARAELADRFASRLAFGTAGLRGELGAGPNRMNRVLVAQAAAGLAAYLTSREPAPTVVIGYDGRMNSDVFARDTAEIMAGAGVRTLLMPRLLPTPVLAFAVRHLGTSAGVMVTASHNPPRDNGYKVYLGGADGGSQINTPADSDIAAQIERVAEHPIADLPRSERYDLVDDTVIDAYVEQTAALAGTPPHGLRFVYTAMHGVGWETSQRVFERAGFDAPVVVREQLLPDPAFPTVAFPNPEEPGALDLAYEAARDSGADLIVAHDPDADRLAIAIPLMPGTAPEGSTDVADAADPARGWRRLTGNEVGALLGWRAAERLQHLDRPGTLAASLVSSPALAAVARKYRLDYADTLTGFKWVSRVGGLAFGYEEALGYLVDPKKVRDKDGISAAVDFLAMASELKAAGSSVAERLREFDARIGAFASTQVSLRFEKRSELPAIMRSLRERPPAHVGELRVERIDDFSGGFGPFPPSDILRVWIEGGSRVIVRPSGTEPKIKVYIDAAGSDGTAEERRATADGIVARLEAGVRQLLQGER
ncbi:phospho-sugar mutase [Ruicaihuangia caeni]